MPVCRACLQTFLDSADRSTFYAPLPSGKRSVDPAEYCFACRLQTKLAWRNLRFLYRVPSALSSKPIISAYGPHVPFAVISHEEWFSDQWDAFSYGRDYDPQETVFTQIARLFRAAPWRALTHYGENENSDYCLSNFSFKNCYLTFWGDYCEDCVNCFHAAYLKDCLDCVQTVYGELACHCANSHHVYNGVALFHSSAIHDSAFLFDCRHCSDCFLCVGLINRRYCFRNEQLSEQAYRRKTAEWDLRRPEVFEAALLELERMSRRVPVRALRNVQCEDVIGNDLSQTARMHNCFFCFGPMSDCAHVVAAGIDVYDSIDLHGCAFDVKHCLDSFTVLRSQDVCFSFNIEDSTDVFYSAHCAHCEHIFGCYGLKRARYCILNKQYTADEYWKQVRKLIDAMQLSGEWGRFFSMELSPFAYDETLAQDYFPLTQEKAGAAGLRWCAIRERLSPAGADQKRLAESESADTGSCAQTGRVFRISTLEQRLREKLIMPAPRFSPEVRLSTLINCGAAPRLFEAVCAACAGPTLSGFAPEAGYRVLCEKCALARV